MLQPTLPKCRRQNMISAFVILFNFSTAAERQEFYFRHFGNAWTLLLLHSLHTILHILLVASHIFLLE